MDNKPRMARRQKKLLLVVAMICLIATLLLYGIELHDPSPVLQGLEVIICTIPILWAMVFPPREPQFPWRWRTPAAIAVGLDSMPLGYIVSTLAYNDFFVMIGVVVCIAPLFLFRITERWKTARDQKHQTSR